MGLNTSQKAPDCCNNCACDHCNMKTDPVVITFPGLSSGMTLGEDPCWEVLAAGAFECTLYCVDPDVGCVCSWWGAVNGQECYPSAEIELDFFPNRPQVSLMIPNWGRYMFYAPPHTDPPCFPLTLTAEWDSSMQAIVQG